MKELRQKKSCVCGGPGAANISQDDAPHWPTTQDTAERNVSDAGPGYRGHGLPPQELPLLPRDERALCRTVSHQHHPGHQPGKGEEAQQVEDKSPVVAEGDIASEESSKDCTELAACIDDGS